MLLDVRNVKKHDLLADIFGGEADNHFHLSKSELAVMEYDDYYMEITRTNNQVSSINYWVDETKAIKVADMNITRDSKNNVSSMITELYNIDGSEVYATLTKTFTRATNGDVISSKTVRS